MSKDTKRWGRRARTASGIIIAFKACCKIESDSKTMHVAFSGQSALEGSRRCMC